MTNNADKMKMFQNLTSLITPISHILILPSSKINPLVFDRIQLLNSKPNLGYKCKRKIAEMSSDKKLTIEGEK